MKPSMIRPLDAPPPVVPPVFAGERAAAMGARGLGERNAGTALTRSRYDRIAPLYDLLEWGMELRSTRWRRELWTRVVPGQILEVGVGTGKNLPFHPPEAEVAAVDLSPRMLERARRRALRLGSRARLELADVQALPFPDASFDTAVATFVFCLVSDALQGLRELRRVLKPGRQLLLLEHVLSERPLLRWLMRRLDPIPFHLWGAHLNRETVQTVQAAGFVRLDAEALSGDVVKRIVAFAPEGGAPAANAEAEPAGRPANRPIHESWSQPNGGVP
jgi:ubiquinone/menaquinone biosynthesis C-methylase UbiE